MTRIGLLVALPGELRTLTNARIESGRFSHLDPNTLICLTGVGPKNAESAAIQLIENECKALVSWGCAAALAPDLNAGDLIVPEKLIGADEVEFDLNNALRRNLLDRINPHQASGSHVLIESTGLVESAAAKQKLWQSSGAGAVDMESVAIARISAKYRLPAVCIRAIADPASMDLPGPVSAAMDDDGNVKISRLLVELLRQPGSIGGLVRLGRSFAAAQRTLRNTARILNHRFASDMQAV